ncbi:MAG: iron-sulfur cluster assembly accessory protein [Nanoarchaeota archaeon]
MAQKQIQRITRDILISEILTINPGKSRILTEMLLDFGIHCVGCGASSFETLGQGVLGHGFSEQQLDKLISDLNKVINEELEPESKTEVDQEITAEIFSLKLTEQAIKKVKEVIKKRGKKNVTLRVSVIPGGCSGYLYDLQFKDQPSKDDLNFKQDGINIAVDKKSTDMLHGMEIEYIDTLNESGFKFNNPNAEHGCGCGKSFG